MSRREDSQNRREQPEVVFTRSEVTIEWDPACESLLDLAQANGLNPPFSCREGACNSCLSRLVEGEVEHFLELLLPPRDDEVLLCCSRPKTRVVIHA